MFTGIITDVGEIAFVTRVAGQSKWGDTRMIVHTRYDVSTIDIGASISHSGACMTVVEKGVLDETEFAGWYSMDVSDESLSKTTMGAWSAGTTVNLERAMTAKDELGGHLVTGHVDATGEILEIESIAGSKRIRFHMPDSIQAAIAPKGSICVDGVSLTVNEVGKDWFEVNIIPHTSEVTTLGKLTIGDKVNLEIDLIARYVARYLSHMKARDD